MHQHDADVSRPWDLAGALTASRSRALCTSNPVPRLEPPAIVCSGHALVRCYRSEHWHRLTTVETELQLDPEAGTIGAAMIGSAAVESATIYYSAQSTPPRNRLGPYSIDLGHIDQSKPGLRAERLWEPGSSLGRDARTATGQTTVAAMAAAAVAAS